MTVHAETRRELDAARGAAETTADPTTDHLFVLRRGGLPFTVLDGLRTAGAAAWADDGERLERERDRRAHDLGLLLELEVVPALDGEARRRAINLRRAVRAGKVPVDGAALRELVETCPALAGPLSALRDASSGLDQHWAEGPAVLASDLRRVRQVLVALAEDPALRGGILLQSPSLDEFVPQLAAGPDDARARQTRRLERGLLNYLYRAAAKTSPFSSLGVISLGRTQERPDEQDAAGGLLRFATSDRAVAMSSLNLALLGRLIEAIGERDDLLLDVPVALNPGLRTEQSRLRYIRRLRRAAQSDTPMDMGGVTESVFFLSEEHVLDELFTVFGSDVQHTSRQVVGALAELLGEQFTPDEIRSYVHTLLRVGFLVTPAHTIDISSPRPVWSYASTLRTFEVPWAEDLAERLEALAAAAESYATSTLEGRRATTAQMHTMLVDLGTVLGDPERFSTLTNLVFEDVADAGGGASLDRRSWEDELLPVLEDYAEVIALYDPAIPSRLAMAAYFRARHGADGVEHDVTRFLHEFGQDCFDQLQQAVLGHRDFDASGQFKPLPNWFKLPEYTAIDQGKLAIRDHVQERVRAEGPQAPVVELDPAWLRDLARTVPGASHDINPRSFFLQVSSRPDRLEAVVNKSYCGLGLHFSRFARLLERAAGSGVVEQVRRRNAAPEGVPVVYAELRGGFDTTNLNLHPHLTDLELVCPGEESFRPAEEQVHLDALSIRSWPDRSGVYLWWDERQVRVVPVYLGFLLPFALPELQRELLLFSYTNMAMPSLWSGVDLGDGGHRPRLVCGPLVLSRRTWFVPVGELPLADGPQDAFRRFHDWRAWARGRGIPEQVFLQPRSSRVSLDRDADTDGGMASKPLFVDFSSEPSVRLLEHSVRAQREEIELVEMLPSPDHLVTDARTGEPFATEITIDINPPSATRQGGQA